MEVDPVRGTVTVTEADHGAAVQLKPGGTLVVRLPTNPSTGYAWHVVQNPHLPFQPSGSSYTADPVAPGIVGSGGVEELRFTARAGGGTFRAWLRLLYLQPFAPGVSDGRLFEVEVTVGP